MSPDLRGLALLFLRLGVTAFGGPAAHIGLMEDEVVHRRGWLTRERFLDLIAASNLIPGPNSTEMAIFIGQARAGVRGLLVAGACFILPATATTLVLAWAYVRWGTLPAGEGLLWGVKPVMIAVVVQALIRLGATALKTRVLGALAAAALAASLLGASEIAALFAAGVLALAARRLAVRPVGPASAVAVEPFSLLALFLVFLKTGALLFGSGYVLLAFLQTDLVERLGWLTEAQLLDAVAAGQVTPGPVFSTATFVGYVVGGVPGAAVATAGIFLPAFLLVAVSGPLVPRLRASPAASAFLDGVVAASLGIMAAVAWRLGVAAVVDAGSAAIALASAVALVRFRVNSAWLVLAGAAIGLVARLART